MDYDRIVAVGLLTENDVQLLGPSFDRLWPVEETPCFIGLLQAIDEAFSEIGGERPQVAPVTTGGVTFGTAA